MAGGNLYLQLQYICQIVLCLYGARHSYVAITNLFKYEETTKKLAKWSTEVEQQLHKTRATQAAGALAILVSLAVSITLALWGTRLHLYTQMALSPIMLVTVMGARGYVKRFWTPTKDGDGKPVGTKVPLPNMGDYNEAVRATEDLLQVLAYLEYSSVAAMVVSAMTGHGRR